MGVFVVWRLEIRSVTDLRGLAEIAVVKAADFGKPHDLTFCRAFDGPQIGCVLVEREMCARPMVVGEVAGQDAVEVSLTEDKHVIQAFAPD
jgi:hypothetical protein